MQHFSEEENDVVFISIRKRNQGFRNHRYMCSAYCAMKFKSTVFCAKEAVSLLWEVRKLLMLLITSGVDSACLLQCVQTAAQVFMVLGNGRSATQRSGLEHILSSI